jgi:lipoic acid synthetase
MSNATRKPEWLRVKIRSGGNMKSVKAILARHRLHTVCTEANCPNRMECFDSRTATFLVLGAVCTRGCTFCDVAGGVPLPPDPGEPAALAAASGELGLRHVVVTSVTRDDLPDGGASHFAAIVHALRAVPTVESIELLIPDLQGLQEALRTVMKARPDVLNHNIETIPRLYAAVRPGADYRRSLELLKSVKSMDNTVKSKSGVMVGLGETESELLQTLRDLRDADCDFLTIGQYLPPSAEAYPLDRYVTPEEFERYREAALELGFLEVASGPLVRSSYHALDMVHPSDH